MSACILQPTLFLTVFVMKFFSLSRTPEGLEDVSKYPELFAALLKDPSWSLQDLKKLAGLNFLRVFKRVEQVKLFFVPLMVIVNKVGSRFSCNEDEIKLFVLVFLSSLCLALKQLETRK